MNLLICCLAMVILNSACLAGNEVFSSGIDKKTGREFDVYKTKNSEVKLTFVGHGSLMIEHKDKVYHVDPWTKIADYSKFPKADGIFITHSHFDHYDKDAVSILFKPNTIVFGPDDVIKDYPDKSKPANEGNSGSFGELKYTAVPAYNIEHLRDGKNPFHPRGFGVGYVFEIDGLKIYVAGDTENIPEMAELSEQKINIALLPMNLPYTMSRNMFVDACNKVKPEILYPYHTVGTESKQFEGKELEALKMECGGAKILIRKME